MIHNISTLFVMITTLYICIFFPITRSKKLLISRAHFCYVWHIMRKCLNCTIELRTVYETTSQCGVFRLFFCFCCSCTSYHQPLFLTSLSCFQVVWVFQKICGGTMTEFGVPWSPDKKSNRNCMGTTGNSEV